jgi:lysophospholipase L1-like esterase
MSRYTLAVAALLVLPLPVRAGEKTPFPFKDGDKVSWIGSSSTKIGVWPKTMEFLLRTRHPELKLTFKSHTTGGGTFATGIQNLGKWLDDSKPTLVFFNYGSNDASADQKGLPTFKENIDKCVRQARDSGARVVLMTPQAADIRKAGVAAAKRRELYAESMLQFAKEKGWPPVIDVFHPLQELQEKGQMDDEKYTILRDTIHLTDPAYIAWGLYLYVGLNPQAVESRATLDAKGKVIAAKGCKVLDVKADADAVAFTRQDEVLPILPPGPLPPRKYVPLEQWSPYMLEVRGLAKGMYEIHCEGKRLGTADAGALAKGVNLNTLVLDSKEAAPWEELAKQIWAGKELDQIGTTRWRFEVRKVKG